MKVNTWSMSWSQSRQDISRKSQGENEPGEGRIGMRAVAIILGLAFGRGRDRLLDDPAGSLPSFVPASRQARLWCM